MSTYVFAEVSLAKWTCLKCKKPLSLFPIYITEKGSLCGRCEELQNGGFRCEIFEEIAKNIEFPCCYKQNGCPENLLPRSVANHELHCKFQTFTCLFKCPNKWKGIAHEFLEHAKKKHPSRVFTECWFEVDFTNTYNETKLMSFLDGLYWIDYRFSWDNGILLLTVRQFRKEPDDNLNFKITFEDSKKQLSHTVFVDLNATFRIKKFELDNFLNNPAVILATIEILQKQPVDGSVTKKVNTELLRHFECIVCMDYMIGPIYLCTEGHSICQSCRDQVTTCPMCRSQIQTTRNYTLEGLASDFEFPCKSDKCMFVGKGTVIKKHQETCNFIEKDCPLKELYGCKKKFVYADLSDHIFKEHNKHWYEGEVISYPFEFDEEYEKVLFLKYCSKLFRLNFSYKIGSFTFVAKLIDGSEESSNYSFVVDILDTTGNKNRLSCSKNLKAEEQAIQFNLASVKHLIHILFSFQMVVLEN